MNVHIGDKVRINYPDRPDSILNGRVYEVVDVTRSIFDREIMSITVNINGSECQFYPENCTVVK